MSGITKMIKKKIRKDCGLETKSGKGLTLAAIGISLAWTLIAVNEFEKQALTYANYEIDTGGRIQDDTRIVFLSDLHETEFGSNNEKLLKKIYDADPDLILMGGDMITVPKDVYQHPEKLSVDVALSLCRKLAEKYPVFYAPGNHEQRLDEKRFEEELKEAGVRYLFDKTVLYKDILIKGLYIDEQYYKPVKPPKMTTEYIYGHVGQPSDKHFSILMAHNPLYTEAYANSGMDLVLSGHFHGGTIRLPGDVGLMTPQFQFFSDKVVGMKQIGSGKQIISSGLGTHSINIRINDKPQVVVVDLKK